MLDCKRNVKEPVYEVNFVDTEKQQDSSLVI